MWEIVAPGLLCYYDNFCEVGCLVLAARQLNTLLRAEWVAFLGGLSLWGEVRMERELECLRWLAERRAVRRRRLARGEYDFLSGLASDESDELSWGSTHSS